MNWRKRKKNVFTPFDIFLFFRPPSIRQNLCALRACSHTANISIRQYEDIFIQVVDHFKVKLFKLFSNKMVPAEWSKQYFQKAGPNVTTKFRGPSQRSGFIQAYHPADPGSKHKHTIQAFTQVYSLILYYVCHRIEERMKINEKRGWLWPIILAYHYDWFKNSHPIKELYFSIAQQCFAKSTLLHWLLIHFVYITI